MTKNSNLHLPIYTHLKPSANGSPIILMQSPQSRAINVGYIRTTKTGDEFIPGRLNLGIQRELHTATASIQSFMIPDVIQIIKQYEPSRISTITLLREAVAYRTGQALFANGIPSYYGDVFIGANHIKEGGQITTAYTYENTEGLADGGLWIISDSICVGRNLISTLNSLLSASRPAELIFLSPIASRSGIDAVESVLAVHHIPTTFIAWGALFGVDEQTLYDMPWGHPLTEVLDLRDKETFLSMYGSKLCVGGDFGNAYFCPPKARVLYEEQLKQQSIVPTIPTAEEIRARYKPDEILTELE